jgi:proteasome-associated ATPase
MFGTRERQLDLSNLIAHVTATGPDAPPIDDRLRALSAFRALGAGQTAQLDRSFLDEIVRLRVGLDEARRHHSELQALLDTLTASPWHPGLFLGAADTEEGERAMVLHAGARRVVSLASGLTADSLTVGDEVLLANGLNVVLSSSPYPTQRSGETAIFQRYMPDGRAVLVWRDEECVVMVAPSLADVALQQGDRVRWDRAAWMVLEKVERTESSALFLEETPADTFAGVGGLDQQIDELKRTIALHVLHAATVRRYHLPRKGSVLMVGPPGTGKTMIARALANWLGTLSPARRARFMNIKPGQLHSVWYSQSEANYREVFRVAREAGEREPDVPVVMFFDEVDAVGAARGESLMRVDDRVQTAFMTELDGLEGRGNILVVAATNRRDALDPALVRPGRLGDLVLDIPRPNGKAASAIFFKHLGADLPYADDYGDSGRARDALVAAAVSRIYAANGDSDVATLTLRDGKRRQVAARELMSGATIAKIARTAVERACLREIEGGDAGVCLRDLLMAVDDECVQVAQVLTPANCRLHLAGLPTDVDVVRVDPVTRKVPQPLKYVAVA